MPIMACFDGRTFKEDRFEAYLERHTFLAAPRSGRLDLDDSKRKTFREMAKLYPSSRRSGNCGTRFRPCGCSVTWTIGEDGRNRAILSAFGSITGRNQPSNAKFISAPVRGSAGSSSRRLDMASLTSIGQQEVGIAAALSGDKNMMADFNAGDPYSSSESARAFAGGRHQDIAEVSHPGVRDMIKACVLGVQYGMGQRPWRFGSGNQPSRPAVSSARTRTSTKFWTMADSAVACAMQGQTIVRCTAGMSGPVTASGAH